MYPSPGRRRPGSSYEALRAIFSPEGALQIQPDGSPSGKEGLLRIAGFDEVLALALQQVENGEMVGFEDVRRNVRDFPVQRGPRVYERTSPDLVRRINYMAGSGDFPEIGHIGGWVVS